MSVKVEVRNKHDKIIKTIVLTEEEFEAISVALEDIDMYVDDEKIMDSIIKKFEVQR